MSVLGRCRIGTIAAKDGSDSTNLPEVSDHPWTYEALFDQYLRSPSPLLAPNKSACELGGAIPLDSGRDEFGGGSTLCLPLLDSPPPESVRENEVNLDDEDTCLVRHGPRIRLRVGQPKTSLRLAVRPVSQSPTTRTQAGSQKVMKQGAKQACKEQRRKKELQSTRRKPRKKREARKT